MTWRSARARSSETRTAPAQRKSRLPIRVASVSASSGLPSIRPARRTLRRRVTVCEPNQKQKSADQRREKQHVAKSAPHILHCEAARMKALRAILRHHLRGVAQILEHLARACITVARIALDRMQHDLLEMRIEIGLEGGRRLRIFRGLRAHHVVNV